MSDGEPPARVPAQFVCRPGTSRSGEYCFPDEPGGKCWGGVPASQTTGCGKPSYAVCPPLYRLPQDTSTECEYITPGILELYPKEMQARLHLPGTTIWADQAALDVAQIISEGKEVPPELPAAKAVQDVTAVREAVRAEGTYPAEYLQEAEAAAKEIWAAALEEGFATEPIPESAYPWMQNQDVAAKSEAAALTIAADALRTEVGDVLYTAKPMADEIVQRQGNTAALRAQLSHAYARGMGSIPMHMCDDPGMSGLFKKIGEEISRVAKRIEKYTLRPIGEALEPIRAPLRKFEKYTIRPAAKGTVAGLRKFEKYTLRPAGKATVQGIAILDKTVPGWTYILDVISPIPFGTILSAFAAGALGSAVSFMQMVSETMGSNTIVGRGTKALVDVARVMATETSVMITQVGSNYAMNAFPLSLAKGTLTWAQTEGDAWDKMRAVSIEAVNGLTMIVGMAAMVAAGPALYALQAALQALQSGMTVLTAWDAAVAVREQADALKKAVAAELERIRKEEAALRAELDAVMSQVASMRAQIESLRAYRLSLEAQAPGAAPVAPVASWAAPGGLTGTQWLVGGLGFTAGVLLLAAALGED